MPWLKVDDGLGVHDKTEDLVRDTPTLGLAAFGLHMLALCHCSRTLSDGFVAQKWVTKRLDDAEIKPVSRTKLLSALEEAGQWASVDGGWVIHDYLDHNPARLDVLAKRAADAERKRRGREAESRRRPPGQDAESARPVPSHTRPTPTSTSESSTATQPYEDSVVVDLPDRSVS